MFGFRKDNKKEEAMLAEHGRMVTLPNGKEISIGELVNGHMEGLKAREEMAKDTAERDEKENKCNEEAKDEDKKENAEDKPLDEVKKNEGEEPEAVEHTALLLQVREMLDAGDIEGAKAALATVTAEEAGEIGGVNKDAPANRIQKNAENEKGEEKEEKPEEKKEEKMNSREYFRRLNQAAAMGSDEGIPAVSTFSSRVNAGAERYGSAKK